MAYKKKGDSIDQQFRGDISKTIVALKKELEKNSDVAVKFGNEIKVTLGSTGILSLDYALSGGIPEGRISEFFGEEQSGKTLVAMLMIAEMQKKYPDKAVILADSEQAWDPVWGESLGIKVNSIIVIQETVLEKVFDEIEDKISKFPISLVVIDSMTAFVTKKEMDKTVSEATNLYADLARVGTIAIRKIQGQLAKCNTSLVVLNQVREDLDPWGPKWRTGGGKALKHLGWTRVHVKKPSGSKFIKEGKYIMGVDMECTIAKHRGRILGEENKADFRVWFDYGLDYIHDLVNMMINAGLISQGGAWFSYKDAEGKDHKWNGIKSVVDYFQNDKEAYVKAHKHAKAFLDNIKNKDLKGGEIDEQEVHSKSNEEV